MGSQPTYSHLSIELMGTYLYTNSYSRLNFKFCVHNNVTGTAYCTMPLTENWNNLRIKPLAWICRKVLRVYTSA